MLIFTQKIQRKATPGPNQTRVVVHVNNGLGTSKTYGTQLLGRNISEEEEYSTDEHLGVSDDEINKVRMSPAAQAAALSTFLSVTNSDSGT